MIEKEKKDDFFSWLKKEGIKEIKNIKQSQFEKITKALTQESNNAK